jgi:hypothetical protein
MFLAMISLRPVRTVRSTSSLRASSSLRSEVAEEEDGTRLSAERLGGGNAAERELARFREGLSRENEEPGKGGVAETLIPDGCKAPSEVGAD